MARRERTQQPGQPQFRRARFCARLLGYVVCLGFLAAIVVGIPFPGVWQAVFVPVLATVPFVLIFLVIVFFSRGQYLKLKARAVAHHFAPLNKLADDPDFR